mgnify:CR=1 FL=1
MINVLITDDQVIVRDGLQVILETDDEIKVVGTASDGAQAIELVEQLKPDLVLMDLKMPGMNGIQATRHIRQHYPHIFVLVLTTYDADEWVFDAIRSGASGYIIKDTPREKLIMAIKETVQGKTHVDPAVAGTLFEHIAKNNPAPQPAIAAELSERELQILQLVAQGLSNGDIAEKLFLSEGTVRNYVSAIFTKLDVSDRTQAVILAFKYGLVDMN